MACGSGRPALRAGSSAAAVEERGSIERLGSMRPKPMGSKMWSLGIAWPAVLLLLGYRARPGRLVVVGSIVVVLQATAGEAWSEEASRRRQQAAARQQGLYCDCGTARPHRCPSLALPARRLARTPSHSAGNQEHCCMTKNTKKRAHSPQCAAHPRAAWARH